ncbi:MAG: hypothetical protein HQ568_08315 [Calditrichaeota bacterium]|nr:hypothetical protein [Calditrichota bacterium]
MNNSNEKSIITKWLMKTIRDQYTLDWHGTHGIHHWLRVRRNGLALCAAHGGCRAFIELFSVLHDCKRIDEGRDLLHGKRAAEYMEIIREDIDYILTPKEFDDLKYAVEYHTTEQHSSNLNIQICWDSDRLDIERVDIILDKNYLNTKSAKNDLFIESLNNIPILNCLPAWFSDYLD